MRPLSIAAAVFLTAGLPVLGVRAQSNEEQPDPSEPAALQVHGYLQVDWILSQASYDQLSSESRQPLNEDRWVLERARLRLEKSAGPLRLVLEPHASTSSGDLTLGLRRTEIGYHMASTRWPDNTFVDVSAGITRVPFGYAVYREDHTDRVFADPPLVARALVPGQYDLGVLASARWRAWDVSMAAHNGEPVGTSAFPLQDPNRAKDFTARVGGVFERDTVRVFAGASLLAGTGFHPGTPATKDILVWRDLNEDGIVSLTELQVIKGSSETPSVNYDRWAAGVDAGVSFDLPSVGPLLLYGEMVLLSNADRGLQPADPVFTGRDQRGLGGYLAAVQEIHNLATVGVRFEYYQPDQDLLDRQGGDLVLAERRFTYLEASLGTGRLHVHDLTGRAFLEASLRDDRRGRDAAGFPADLADNRLLLRVEAGF